MEGKMKLLSPFLVIAMVLSLVTGAIAVSSQTDLANAENGTTLTVEITYPDPGTQFSTCQYFFVDATITNTGDNPATGVSALLSVSPETACEIISTNPIELAYDIGVKGEAGVAWNLHCLEAGDATLTVDVTAVNASPVTDSVSITQVPPAELEVVITSPQTCTYVSICEDFALDVTISNTGEADAENVTATVNITGNASVVSGPEPPIPWDIPGGNSQNVSWVLHCDGEGDVTITVAAKGYDANSGYLVIATSDPVTVHQEPTGPGGAKAYLVADITEPLDGATFSTCQNFDLVFTVSNTGQANALSVTATIDPGATAEVDDLGAGVPDTVDVGDIPAGETAGPITVGMHCVASGDSTITVTPAGIDENTNLPIPEDNLVADSVTVHQEEKAHLVVEIQSPVDSTIFSTCQNFDLVFTVTNTGQADALGVTATIDPGATAEVDSLGAGVPHTVDVGDIPGGGTAGPITVEMHCVASGDSTITVTPAGIDENTNLPIPEDNLVADSVTVHQEDELPPPEEPGSRTLGFYKNHPCVVAQVLPITIAGEEVTDVDRVIEIIEDRDTHWSRLLSQLMVTKLNVAVFGIGGCTLEELGLEGDETVNEVIAQAEALLADPGATKGQLSAMQDLLDRINNSNDDVPLPEEIADACPPGKGKSGKGK